MSDNAADVIAFSVAMLSIVLIVWAVAWGNRR